MGSSAKTLAFAMQRQEKTEWCWAAVSSSVEHFFAPGSQQTQCSIASEELSRKCCGPLKTRAESLCNIPGTLHEPLGRLGWLAAAPIVDSVEFDVIRREIDAGQPVCVLIKWLDDLAMGHFIAIAGYRESGNYRFVQIQDPLFGESAIEYSAFRNPKGGYRDGRGVWFATFLLGSRK